MGNWKRISEYPIYEVSDVGEVRNSETGRILKPRSVNGYSHVTLCDKDGHHQRSIHRLVATEFIPNPTNRPMVNHIDGNRTNNQVDNLEWCTNSENMKHAYRTGLQKVIPSQIAYSLSKSREVRQRPVQNIETGITYESIVDCAKSENITPSAISYHLSGVTKKCRYRYAD